MKKYFLADEEIVADKEFGTVRKPKGIEGINVNWAAIDLGSKGFLVLVDTSDNDLMNQVVASNGIQEIVDTSQSRKAIESKLKISKLQDGDIIEAIVKKFDSLFTKDKLKAGN